MHSYRREVFNEQNLFQNNFARGAWTAYACCMSLELRDSFFLGKSFRYHSYEPKRFLYHNTFISSQYFTHQSQQSKSRFNVLFVFRHSELSLAQFKSRKEAPNSPRVLPSSLKQSQAHQPPPLFKTNSQSLPPRPSNKLS